MRIEFGIPSIDQLINPFKQQSEYTKSVKSQRESVCIIGPDGVGKSILAMHAASWYWLATSSDQDQSVSPIIIYASTDFRYKQFKEAWEAFGLHQPGKRASSLHELVDYNFSDYKSLDDSKLRQLQEELDSSSGGNVDFEVNVKPAVPFDEVPDWLKKSQPREWSSVEKILSPSEEKGTSPVWFLDIADFSGGDDWLMINRLCGMLSTVPANDYVPHLFILDAVEGIEAMTGEVDPYGSRHNRRSRVAQFMRTAASANVSTVLIVEETKDDYRLPEQFIADTVIRLKSDRDADYHRRTVEVEKARSKAHMRGVHDLIVSNGAGTVTGETDNKKCHVDDPKVTLGNGIDWNYSNGDQSSLSYMFSAHSLHAHSHQLRQKQNSVPKLHANPDFPLFGLEHLRNMLGQRPLGDEPDFASGSGSVTVLMGDSGTFKSKLGRNFLSLPFAFEETSGTACSALISSYAADIDDLSEHITDHAKYAIKESGWNSGIEADPKTRINEAVQEGRLITRRIPLHYMTSGLFMRIVRSHIDRCQHLLLNDTQVKGEYETAVGPDKKLNVLRKHSWKIRIVIDDWNLLLASHPAMARDPLLLPALYYLLRRSGVTALIVSTKPERPLLPSRFTDSESPNNLRTLDTHQVLVWPVQFFGERRVAITAASGSSMIARSIAYELLPLTDEDYKEMDQEEAESRKDRELLRIDRRFALYSGLQENRPKRIPLRLRLFLDSSIEQEGRKSYLHEVTKTFTELFPDEDGKPVVTHEPINSYGDFASSVDWMDDTTIDFSHVLQLDEFWLQDRSLNNLLSLDKYLHSTTSIFSSEQQKKVKPVIDSDPLRRFQPHVTEEGENCYPPGVKQEGVKQMIRRIDFFPPEILTRDTKDPTCSDGSHTGYEREKEKFTFDRVPYLKDFGFILARRDLWERSLKDPGAPDSVKDSWDNLCLCTDVDSFFDHQKVNDCIGNESVSWADFFEACEYVKGSQTVPAFDVDFSIGETLNALLLEVWFSEIIGTKTTDDDFFHLSLRNGKRIPSLKKLCHSQSLTLFVALSRLMQASSHLLGDRIQTHSPADTNAVAARHWYTSAVVAMRENPNLIPMRLPGHYSVRGDWFVGASRGSRSWLNAHRAIDILTSRRMNLLRLHDGLGLPARELSSPGSQKQTLTALQISHPKLEYRRKISLEQLEMLEGSLGNCPEAETFEERIEEWIGATQEEKNASFMPLWRSQIDNYDRHSFHLYRWIENIFWNSDRSVGTFDVLANEELMNSLKLFSGFNSPDDETYFIERPEVAEIRSTIEAFTCLRDQLTSALRE